MALFRKGVLLLCLMTMMVVAVATSSWEDKKDRLQMCIWKTNNLLTVLNKKENVETIKACKQSLLSGKRNLNGTLTEMLHTQNISQEFAKSPNISNTAQVIRRDIIASSNKISHMLLKSAFIQIQKCSKSMSESISKDTNDVVVLLDDLRRCVRSLTAMRPFLSSAPHKTTTGKPLSEEASSESESVEVASSVVSIPAVSSDLTPSRNRSHNLGKQLARNQELRQEDSSLQSNLSNGVPEFDDDQSGGNN